MSAKSRLARDARHAPPEGVPPPQEGAPHPHRGDPSRVVGSPTYTWYEGDRPPRLVIARTGTPRAPPPGRRRYGRTRPSTRHALFSPHRGCPDIHCAPRVTHRSKRFHRFMTLHGDHPTGPRGARMGIRVSHAYGEHIAVAAADGTEILRYVYRPDPDAFEARKPYAHPLRTLAGRTVTGYRPSDHRWHKGLQMTASHLSGQNFWGGNSYVHRPGLPAGRRARRLDAARRLRGVHGRPTTGCASPRSSPGSRTAARSGRASCAPRRALGRAGRGHLGAGLVDPPHQHPWRAAAFGSPTTAGREMAGYTGLKWRGPRDFTGGDGLRPGRRRRGRRGRLEADGHPGRGPGSPSPPSTTTSTRTPRSLFAHAPENLDEQPRSTPRTGSCAPSRSPRSRSPGRSSRSSSCRRASPSATATGVVVADGAWDRTRVERLPGGPRW